MQRLDFLLTFIHDLQFETMNHSKINVSNFATCGQLCTPKRISKKIYLVSPSLSEMNVQHNVYMVTAAQYYLDSEKIIKLMQSLNVSP